MDCNISRSLSGIDCISKSLNSSKEPLPKERADKIISNIGKLLSHLESHVNCGFTPLTETFKPEIQDSLIRLQQGLSSLKSDSPECEKISQLNKRIENIQAAVNVTSIFEKKVKPLEAVNLAYFCDIDSKDYTGAMGPIIRNAVSSGIAFIAPISLIKGKELDIISDSISIPFKYTIYEKNGLLIFMPIDDSSMKTPHEMLAKYDLKTEGLTSITLEDVMKLTSKEATISTLANLFEEKPKVNKMFYVSGHGGDGSVAGMEAKKFKEFFEFLEVQKCQGLMINTCHGGGGSSLEISPETDSKGSNFLSQNKEQSIPVIVSSLGDFPISGRCDADKNINGSLSTFKKFLQSTNLKNTEHLGKLFNEFEKGKSKPPSNLMQYYPSHSPDIPIGFRHINERKEDFILTELKVKQAELASKKIDIEKPKFLSDISPEVRVNNAKRMEILPLVTNPPVIFIEANPILLSAIPGRAHHYLKEIRLESSLKEDPIDFIMRTINFHKTNDVGESKLFSIEKISSSTKTIDNMFAFIDVHGSKCGFQEDGKFFSVIKNDSDNFTAAILFRPIGYLNKLPASEVIKKTEIKFIDYYRLYDRCIQNTISREKAVRMATAGLESEKNFQEAFNAAIKILFDALAKNEKKEFLIHLVYANPRFVSELLFHDNDPVLFNKFIKQFSPNDISYIIEAFSDFPSNQMEAIFTQLVPFLKTRGRKNELIESIKEINSRNQEYTVENAKKLMEKLEYTGKDVNYIFDIIKSLDLISREEQDTIVNEAGISADEIKYFYNAIGLQPLLTYYLLPDYLKNPKRLAEVKNQEWFKDDEYIKAIVKSVKEKFENGNLSLSDQMSFAKYINKFIDNGFLTFSDEDPFKQKIDQIISES